MKTVRTFLMIAILTVSSSHARDEICWVINTTGETLSRINLTTGAVSNNVLPLGSDVFCFPNQIVVRDSIAYVVASGTNEIQLIDLNSVSTVAFIYTGPFTNPYWMAFVDGQFAYVTCLITDEVIKVDMVARAVVDRIPIGMSPEGILISDYKAYVAITAFDFTNWTYGQGQVAVVDIRGDTVLTHIDVGKNPQFLARDAAGRVHVVCTGDYVTAFGIIYTIDPAVDAVIDSIATGGSPGQISIGPDDLAYVAAGGWTNDGYVYTFDAATGLLHHGSTSPLLVDSGCIMVAAYQDSTCFTGGFKDFVNAIDSSGMVLGAYAVGDGPAHAAFNYVPGDVNGDFVVNVVDLSTMVNWLFNEGPPPRYPRWRANVNADGGYNIIDVTYLVAYLFAGGSPPRMGPTWLWW